MDKASKRGNTISNQMRQGIAKIVPSYAIIPLLSCLAWNCVVYWSTQVLCAHRPHFDFSTAFDQALPFQSWWILIYVSSFVFWPLCYVMTAKYNSKEFFFRFGDSGSAVKNHLRDFFHRAADDQCAGRSLRSAASVIGCLR